MQAPESVDIFALDVRVVIDALASQGSGRACDTSDGCAPSCASSCNSRP